MSFLRSIVPAVLLLILSTPATAQFSNFTNANKDLREYAVFAGYGESHRIPTTTQETLDFSVFKFRYAKFTSPRTVVGYEFSVGSQLEDGDNLIFTGLLTYRRNFLVREKTSLGYDLGIGASYLTEYVEGHSTKANFTEQVGLTLQIATSSSSAFMLEYRFSHISNANLKRPNRGVNASTISIGYAWYR